MRTSATQIEIMVSYMESHGDLSKPSDGPNGRVTNIQRWAELVTLLNAEGSGDFKTEEKWRKTWSDLKNNCKRKAAKINKLSCGTGGGPASKLKLSALEERILSLINPQAAFGIEGVHEVGMLQDVIVTEDIPTSEVDPIAAGSENLEEWNIPGTSSQQLILTPQPPPPPATPSPPKPSRRRHFSHMGPSPKRRRPATTTQSELARQAFLDSDREWRAFKIEKETKNYELEKERLRLREIELQQQGKFLELFAQFLVIVKEIGDNLKK